MFPTKSALLLFTLFEASFAYMGLMSFRSDPKPKYERPEIVTIFIDSLSEQQKTSLRAILEDTSATKAEGWTKLMAFVANLRDRQVEAGEQAFGLLVGFRDKQLAEEKRDFPEVSKYIDRVLAIVQDQNISLRKECEKFQSVLNLVKEDAKVSDNLRLVAEKVHGRLGDCANYAHQIADILLANRLPAVEL